MMNIDQDDEDPCYTSENTTKFFNNILIQAPSATTDDDLMSMMTSEDRSPKAKAKKHRRHSSSTASDSSSRARHPPPVAHAIVVDDDMLIQGTAANLKLPSIAEEGNHLFFQEGQQQSVPYNTAGDVKMGVTMEMYHPHHPRHDESSLSSLETDPTSSPQLLQTDQDADTSPIQFLVATPHGRTAAVNFRRSDLLTKTYEEFCGVLLQAARARDLGIEKGSEENENLSNYSSPQGKALAAASLKTASRTQTYHKTSPHVSSAKKPLARSKHKRELQNRKEKFKLSSKRASHQATEEDQTTAMMMDEDEVCNLKGNSYHQRILKNVVVEEDDDGHQSEAINSVKHNAFPSIGINNTATHHHHHHSWLGFHSDDDEDNNTETSLMNTAKRALVVVDDCEPSPRPIKRRRVHEILLVHEGKIIEKESFGMLAKMQSPCYLGLKLAIVGGIDRQNRVGSKFGGGGVSSSQQAERERKERLKQLALESIDLAKDPYLMRNHLGTYECKLCLTLHTNEANYLAHTQGKKHQQGLARRAHMEKLKQEREGGVQPAASTAAAPAKRARVKIGRPAYQVFKSRDPESKQRCLSFELNYPEIDSDLQPRHRFMSAFEQRVESPPDRRYQYLLFAADPYETVAFKIPNEPIDKGEGRFVTHWDAEEKKFILTLYFTEQGSGGAANGQSTGAAPKP